ncbi:hypothetical protein [Amycolatopsis sp. NPDC004079]|uniref:hypothetical protein n=1 Tax=Amycolatopsis sp. NPDC004079 TaxID=3154549 RepID=UPI0033A0D8D2
MTETGAAEQADGLVEYGTFRDFSTEGWACPEEMAEAHITAAAKYEPELVAVVRDDAERRAEFADLLAEDIMRSVDSCYASRASGPASSEKVVLRREDNMFVGLGPVPENVREVVGEAIEMAWWAAPKLFGHVLVGVRPTWPLF